jgi:hypothetical protein
MPDDLVTFNGVDADTGDYLTPPAPLPGVASEIRGGPAAGPHLDELRRRRRDDEDSLGIMFGRDPQNLGSAGWGLVVPDPVDPAVLEALEPLLALRREQAGSLFKQLAVHPGESKDAFLRRYDMTPGPADPRRVPYYLLIVGGPTQIPFAFQYQLDVAYGVGRVHFDSPDDYARYAATVAAAERPAGAAAERPAGAGPEPVHVFAVRNPGDTPTALSAARLAQPLAAELRELAAGQAVTEDVGEAATRQRLQDLLEQRASPILFTASHGLGAGGGADGDRQREIQGALLCQDWPGPLAASRAVTEDHYLAGAHICRDRPVRPRVMFSFACYGAGTPSISDFSDGGSGPRSRLAAESFVARLPQRLLANPAGGALAFVGHVDRAWSYSFLWKGIDPQITSFASTMLALARGSRLGWAMESLNSRYAEVATELTSRMDENRRYGKAIDDAELVGLWTAHNDARSYVVFGDPAVRAVAPPAPAVPPPGRPAGA